MSTYYYDLKKPWSRIEVDENPESYVIRLWDGQMHQAGVLTLTVEDGREAIYNFFHDEAACQSYVDHQRPCCVNSEGSVPVRYSASTAPS